MKKLIVFLHGFGSTQNEQSDLVSSLRKEFPSYSYLGVDAPYDSLRERGGWSWFDIQKEDKKWILDDGKLSTSLSYLKTEINQKLNELSLSWGDLILVGRSQGSFVSILLASEHNIPCHAVVCLGSRFIKTASIQIRSHSPILWFESEFEKPDASREKLDVYKYLLSKGMDLHYFIAKNSDHDFISPETTQLIINELQKLELK